MPASSGSLERILRKKIVAVIRADRSDALVDVAEALLDGGIEVMEVTFTVPGAHEVLREVAERFGDRILLGAGTVLDSETARVAILSGAEFIVSPGTDPGTIELCRRYSKPVMPGALTPTEAITAWQAGADIVKIFPSNLGGPSYLKALAAPLPQIRFMPTGGVDLDTATDYLRAGACALGVGGSLVSARNVRQGKMDQIRDLARKFVQIVEQFEADHASSSESVEDRR